MNRRDITDQLVCLAYIEAERLREGKPGVGLPLGNVVWPYHILMDWFPTAPFKVVYRAMERASDRGCIEYGTSLRSGWLTDKGLRAVYGDNWRDKVPQVPIPQYTSLPWRQAP